MTPINHQADWRTKLTQAMEGVSDEDHERLYKDAADWKTCACGEPDDWIERWSDGSPVNPGLKRLGSKFYGNVWCGNFSQALTTLDAIEARAAELKP